MKAKHLLVSAAAVAVLLSSGCATPSASPSSAAPLDISAQRISDDIRTISADAYQGRYPGTDGERMTMAWLQAQYEAMGLEPGGRDGQWLQAVTLKRFTPVADSVRASWTGPDGTSHALTSGTDLIVRAATNDGRADINDAELVFVGYGITAPERNWDDYGRADVRGKVVVYVPGEPEGDLFNGPYSTNYDSTAYKADEAFRRGAVGIIGLRPANAGSPEWRQLVGSSMGRRTLTPGAADLEFSAAVPHDVAMAWAQAAGMDLARLQNIAGGGFKAVTLPGVRLSMSARETSDTLVTHNLLAKLTGRTHPNETVIYSAHWDHVGGAAQHPNHPGEDKIWNGAWDNASGTVGVVEMARQYARAPRPERTVVFAHMAAEEMGLLGAYGYAADPIYPLETTVADINIDMLPLSPPTKDVAIFGKGQNELEDDLARLAAAEGRYVTDDREPQQGYYYRSDHFPFARGGVPALMPWHGVDWDEGGTAAGLPAYRAYFDAVYHKPTDEWRADWDLRSAVENLTILYRLGSDLANSRRWPGWKPTSEFAAVRARTDAARR